ncbi:MAG: Uma2 family endonuclease [Pseudanabaenaceae cyanobacterium SKYGB_i_bin29]|nr:Uma2 family endonuclease [Pseudanabaenaceae cyanobacterium SKYG29]MDW8420280.1 Uma2 family endonuclease [Pseudanabaenaceae cyanobacterium SKYGB_i_bin29]
MLIERLPSSAELPCSDDTPVDNEDQNLIPNILLFSLLQYWHDREDWFFAVDMGIYHPSQPRTPIVPDAFLCVGVPRRRGGKSRLSYVLWEEDNIVPVLVIEMVSQTPGGEYSRKMQVYQSMGVLYYAIYNPEYWQRDRREPFMVYKLVGGEYEVQGGEPVWMAEVGLGIGRCWVGAREQLSWFDGAGNRILSLEELLAKERQEKEAERKAKEKLAQYLRSLGIDPDQLM